MSLFRGGYFLKTVLLGSLLFQTKNGEALDFKKNPSSPPLLREWRILDKRIQDLSKKEAELTNKKLELELSLASMNEAIKDLTVSTENKRLAITQQSTYLERNQGGDLLRNLIESENPGVAERNVHMLALVTQSYLVQIRQYNNDLNKLESEQRLYSRRLAQINSLQRDMKNQLNRYFEELKQKSVLVNKLRSRFKQSAQKWQAKLNEALKNKNSAQISLYSSLLNKSFYDRKGQLTSPTDYPLAIAFGPLRPTQNSPLLPFHGLLFEAPQGTPIRAMTDGIIEWVGAVQGLGPTIIIDHGLGVRSVYGRVKVGPFLVGSSVKEGEILGKVDKTDFIFKEGLYFEVREGTLPTDPQRWIITKSDLLRKESTQWENVQ